VVDVGPEGQPRWAVHDDAPLDCVERDEDGGYEGAVRVAFYVRGTTVSGE
jgi:hypothetical protein